VVLFEEIKGRGYPGGYSTVKQFVPSKKPKSAVEPDNRFETAPGQQLQVDFTTLRRGRDPVKALVATLGFSRSTYVRFSRHERQEDWLTGIELALDHFGGVPQELLLHNAKCIMLERDAYGRGSHRWNPDLLLMAKHYGFIPRACRPYRARTKSEGKVERFNRYLKQSFETLLMATVSQAGLAFDADVANAYVGPWLTETAEQRLHGTTKQRPSSLLEEERMVLLPLPPTGWQLKIDPPSVWTLQTVAPIESLQHPLSVYDALLDAVV